MNPLHIVYLAFIIILIFSVILNTVLISIIINLNNKIVILKQERNYLQQDIIKAKTEILEKEKILKRQNDLLLKVKNAKNYKDYLEIWEQIK